MADVTDEEMTIGALAAAAGVTARTIRHYESAGLLDAPERSVGGHRRYRSGELDRLRRILVLRRCGFGLESIQRLLDAPSTGDALALARRQLERSEVELVVARRLRGRMRRFVEMLEDTEGNSIEDSIAEMEVDGMNVTLDLISTGLGDAGETDLADGTRVAKTDPVIEAVGSVEELGAQLGLILAGDEVENRDLLEQVANDLFDVGSDLSSPVREGNGHPRMGDAYVERLEQSVVAVNSKLEPLDSFVAWFAVPAAARWHACRAVCRRAERSVFAVDDANPHVGRYLNRLSDLLFVLARAEAAGRERLWEPGRGAA
jgi:cob(I)alamin adenosyltransferase